MNQDDPRRIKDLPPRKLTLFTKVIILFGGRNNNIGWAIIAFGMIFVWAFTTFNTPIYWFKYFQNWETTLATITKVSETNGSVNDEAIYQYDYNFNYNNQTYQGVAFSTGRKFNDGTVKEIEFNVNKPNQSQMKETRRTLFGRFAATFVAIFPLIGFSFIYFTTKKNWNFLKLLRDGDSTRAELISKKSAETVKSDGDNTRPEYNYVFEFEYTNSSGQSLKYLSKCKTHLTERVEDELKEIVLFDRFNPENNIIYDSIENAPYINPDGYLEQAPISKSWNLLFPLITFLGHGYYYLYHVLLV